MKPNVPQCCELINTQPNRLGRYCGSGVRQCRNKGTVRTLTGIFCKRHSPKKPEIGIHFMPGFCK